MTEHRVVLALRLAADVPLHLESALQTIQEARRTARVAGRVSGEVDAHGKALRVLARPRAAVAPRWYGRPWPLSSSSLPELHHGLKAAGPKKAQPCLAAHGNKATSTVMRGIEGKEVKGRREIGKEGGKARMAGDPFQPCLQGAG